MVGVAGAAQSSWAALREAQLRVAHGATAGLVVTIDRGDADDIHPKSKIDVGHRLARWASGRLRKGRSLLLDRFTTRSVPKAIGSASASHT
jgi:hypothetical protein